ncbi:MAG: TIGR00282 family metallophosphoesterase [Deltaproteobacteria bacterium]
MGDTAGVLFIGDIIGRPGRMAVKERLHSLIKEYLPDIVIANGENAAGGFGITPDIAEELKALSIDVITSGNHIWDKKEIYESIRADKRLLRPANYPDGSPGAGWTVVACPAGHDIGVLNLSGRVFMEAIDCPFRAASDALKKIKDLAKIVIVDMHAEATSEKAAMAWFLDGQVSAVIGTHTHVQTSDERLLPRGTAFITDAGATGPADGIIGMQREAIIQRFLTQMPARFDVASGRVEIQGVFVSVSARTGMALSIERIRRAV